MFTKYPHFQKTDYPSFIYVEENMVEWFGSILIQSKRIPNQQHKVTHRTEKEGAASLKSHFQKIWHIERF